MRIQDGAKEWGEGEGGGRGGARGRRGRYKGRAGDAEAVRVALPRGLDDAASCQQRHGGSGLLVERLETVACEWRQSRRNECCGTGAAARNRCNPSWVPDHLGELQRFLHARLPPPPHSPRHNRKQENAEIAGCCQGKEQSWRRGEGGRGKNAGLMRALISCIEIFPSPSLSSHWKCGEWVMSCNLVPSPIGSNGIGWSICSLDILDVGADSELAAHRFDLIPVHSDVSITLKNLLPNTKSRHQS